jgi:NTE family protein
MTPNIENLVFEGGGVLGIAYAGAIEVLEKFKILQKIKRVAGTSVGAITATLLALRYNAEEIKQIILSTDFKSFQKGWNPLRITTKYGLYKGDVFLDWIKQLIIKKALPQDATFEDFQDAGCRELRIFATDLNMRNIRTFSIRTSPNVVVAEAIRASMAIPLFFEAWQFSNHNPDDHVYVDGGIIFNYPITTFDTNDKPNAKTMGFHLDNLKGSSLIDDLKFDQLFQYVKAFFNTLSEAQVIAFNNNPSDIKRSVRIDNFGISITDFNISEEKKLKLYNSGKHYTTEYINQHLRKHFLARIFNKSYLSKNQLK